MHIVLDAERKAEIESCFSCEVEFHYPNEIDNFNDFLEEFKAQSNTAKNRANDTYSSENIVSNTFGEETKRDRLIVMDNVSGLAGEPNKFAKILHVAHKFNYSSFYIFHTIYREKLIWRTILWQSKIFNIFPASVSFSNV